MTDRCGNCGHDEDRHHSQDGCLWWNPIVGDGCSCLGYRPRVTLELARCAKAGCGHPKFRHDHNGICRSCWCNTYTEKEKLMTDDKFVPLAEDVRHAARVLKALDRMDVEVFLCSGPRTYTADWLWGRAIQMETEAEQARRRRDKLFQLASDITVGGSRGEGDWLNVYKVAEFLLEQGWDKPDTETAT